MNDSDELLSDLELYLEIYDEEAISEEHGRLRARFIALGLEPRYLLDREWPGWTEAARICHLEHLTDYELAELASYYPDKTKAN